MPDTSETLHGPAVLAAALRAAFEEGIAVAASSAVAPAVIDEMWNASAAKKTSGAILSNAGDPTRAERLLGLYREWASCSPDDEGGYQAAHKRACTLMKQMHELIGDMPFDAVTRRPKEATNGGNR